MKRLMVYIAGPISKGDLLHNVNQATEAFVTLARAGIAPLCPHWSVYSKRAFKFDHLGKVYCEATVQGNDLMNHADWLNIDLEFVSRSDAVLRLPGESSGADTEVAFARSRMIPVFFGIDELLDWKRSKME